MSREVSLLSALRSAGIVSRPSRFAGVVLCGLLAVGGLGLAATPLVDSEHYVVDSVRVEGLHHAGQAEIRHLANIPAATKLWDVDIDATAASVVAHPWVRSATATRDWPDAVTIRVEE